MSVDASNPGPLQEEWANRLRAAASLHAREAISLLEKTDTQDLLEKLRAAEHAGACVELLSKALIAQQHPVSVLLSRDCKPEIRRAIRRAGPMPTEEDLRHAVTIAATEAVTYLADLLNQKQIPGAYKVLKSRNCAVHAALTPDLKELGYSLGGFLRAALPEEAARKDFLGYQAHRILEQRYSELLAQLDQKIVKAKQKYRQMIVGKTPADIQKIVASRRQRVNRPSRTDLGEWTSVICPACDHEADFLEECVGEETEYEFPGEISSYPIFEYQLECAVCELTMNSAEVESRAEDLEFPDGSVLVTVG